MSCAIEAFDAAAPEKSRSAALMPGARGVIVSASAGPALWRAFRARMDAEPALWELEHPYDAFVATILARGDAALSHAGIGFRRFEAAFHATPRMDFLALSRSTAWGTRVSFLLHIHAKYGPWWALRGAWLVDAEVAPPLSDAAPCDGCAAPCVGGWENAGGLVRATPEWAVRRRAGAPVRR